LVFLAILKIPHYVKRKKKKKKKNRNSERYTPLSELFRINVLQVYYIQVISIFKIKYSLMNCYTYYLKMSLERLRKTVRENSG
jgi:hypothetical protein